MTLHSDQDGAACADVVLRLHLFLAMQTAENLAHADGGGDALCVLRCRSCGAPGQVPGETEAHGGRFDEGFAGVGAEVAGGVGGKADGVGKGIGEGPGAREADGHVVGLLAVLVAPEELHVVVALEQRRLTRRGLLQVDRADCPRDGGADDEHHRQPPNPAAQDPALPFARPRVRLQDEQRA